MVGPLYIDHELEPKKIEVTGGHGGRLRPFEAKVKLWVSKFIFFHADSGNGLKHNFEAVFEANLRLFCYLKAYLKGFQCF